MALARRRRSVRWFLQQPVPREMIDRAIGLAELSPTACNRQPYEFLVYDRADLISMAAALPGGTEGFAHNIPCLVVILGRMRAFESERDRHLIYIDGALASMSFQFALETLGLASCSINWSDAPRRERRMAQVLGLDLDERPVMLMAVGFPDPDGLVPSSQKKDLEQIRCYNRAAPTRRSEADKGNDNGSLSAAGVCESEETQ